MSFELLKVIHVSFLEKFGVFGEVISKVQDNFKCIGNMGLMP